MQILLAIDMDDAAVAEAYGDEIGTPYADDDLVASYVARLDEVYLGRDNWPVKGRVLALGDFTSVLDGALDAMEVGADGLDDSDAGHVLGSIATMRQMLG